MTRGKHNAVNPSLLIESRSSIATVRFNRSSQRNPLSTATLRELEEAVAALANHSEIKALIFTGMNGVFASGADIHELRALTSETAGEFSRRGQRLFQSMVEAKQLTIAAVNGCCVGGALDLALACDLRFASSDAVFAHPGARLGIITGWGGTQRLPRLIGAARAIEMSATARRLTSAEAYEFGLVNRVCDPVVDCARGYALSITPSRG